MRTQITIKNIVEELVDFGNKHQKVNTSIFGDLLAIVGNGNVVYPLFNVDLIDGEITDKQIKYSINIICADIKELDDSKLLNAYNTTSQILIDLHYFLIRASKFKNNWKVDSGVSFRAFPHKFIDNVAGNVLNLTVIVDNRSCLNLIEYEGGIT